MSDLKKYIQAYDAFKRSDLGKQLPFDMIYEIATAANFEFVNIVVLENDISADDLELVSKFINILNFEDNISITILNSRLFDRLTSLELSGDNNLDGGCLHMFPDLKHLLLSNTDFKITDQHISKLTNLKTLRISGEHDLTDAGLSCLTNLECLDISPDDCIYETDDEIKFNSYNHSRHYSKYEYVQRYKKAVSDKSLSTLTKLTFLRIDGYQLVTDKSIIKLVNLTNLNLRCLDHISDHSIGALVSLKHLTIAACKSITDEGLIPLTNLIT